MDVQSPVRQLELGLAASRSNGSQIYEQAKKIYGRCQMRMKIRLLYIQ